MWKKILDDIIPYKPGKPIDEVKRELGLKEVIKLASNENPLGASPKAVKALIAAAGEMNRYPDGGCFQLRKALSEKLGVPEDGLVFGNGSDELIVMALRAFVDPGDEVIISDPTFLVYKIASYVQGAKIKVAPCKEMKYDLEAMLANITSKTKVIFIANPENPTGSYINADELNSFIKKVPENILIFLDEAYYEFAVGDDYPETLTYVKEEKGNIVVARTFSKAYGLAGLRIGYAAARTDIARAINTVREPFNVNAAGQIAALAALDDAEFLKKSVDLVRDEKKKLYEVFSETDVKAYPSRTNFVLIDIKRDSKKISDFMLKRGIVIRDMAAWGMKGFIRVNVGLPEENIKFAEVFREAVNTLPKAK